MTVPEAAWGIIEFRGRAGLERLEADWRRLYARIPRRTSFLSYEACRAHVDQLMSAPDQLRCLALTDGRRVRAICALQPRSDRPLGPLLRVWGVLWHVHGLQADVLCADDEARRALIPAVVDHLSRKPEGRQLLLLGSAPAGSALWHGLRGLRPATYRVEPKQSVNVLDCSMPFTELRGALSKSFRHKLNTAANRLAKLSDVRFAAVTTATGDLEAELEAFLDVEASGWKGDGGTGTAIRCSRQKTAFFRDLAVNLRGDADYAEVSALYAEGRCLASSFCTRTGDTYSCLKIGYDEAFGRVSPGQILVENMVRRCCEDPGIKRLDMVSDATWVRGWRPDTVPLQLAYVTIARAPAAPLVAALLQLRFGPGRELVGQVRRRLAARKEARTHAGTTPGA